MSRAVDTARRGLRALRPALPGATRVVAGAGAAAGLVWAATTVPGALDLAAASGSAAAPVARTSLATSVAAMCPGTELSGIPGVDDRRVDGRVEAVTGPEDLLPVPADGAGRARLVGDDGTLAELTARPDAVEEDLPDTGPVLLTADGALAPAVTATQEWLRTSSDLRGLVTTPCLPASSDLWLVGGGDGPGRQERLVLANPGGNPVTATVTVLGGAGSVAPPQAQTVPAGGRTTLLLDAVAGTEAMPVVHVVADGGGLHATLTDTWLDGSTPLGAETVVPTAAPGTVQVVPATVVSGRTTLRVAAPGEDEAVASVTLLGPKGPVATTEDTVLTVPAEGVGELRLPDVPDGVYTAVVRADVPVVAATLSTVGDPESRGDLAWSVSAPVVTEVAGLALPDTPKVSRTLHLVSTGGASTADVTLVVDGEERTRTVDLLSERSTDVDLEDASAVWVRRGSGAGALRGGVVSTAGRGGSAVLSVVPLEPVAVTSPVSRSFPMP
ncbi:DUF5719 family protein [Phycicoccus flavus]|uniref:DUF5719 family protein n=1 Tax=Phycicoccus flavus TaxID=2502783 RepID=UPI000FEBB6A5|nr:DUF5719 family protein [Phycicoccus flavus]NHA67990.1 hypothetical protein [Phycicoccus flavus]